MKIYCSASKRVLRIEIAAQIISEPNLRKKKSTNPMTYNGFLVRTVRYDASASQTGGRGFMTGGRSRNICFV